MFSVEPHNFLFPDNNFKKFYIQVLLEIQKLTDISVKLDNY